MVRVVIFILIAILNCAKPEAANPNDQGTDEFWQKQAFLCLVGQINLCTSTPPSPAAPTVTAGNTENIVTWSSVSGATSYNLVYGTSAGVTRASGTVISSVVSPYTHSGLTNNTTYYYTVVAKVGTTESNLSQEASATPFCSPCRMFTTSSTFNGSMTRSDSVVGTGPTGIAKADNWCMVDTNKPTSLSSAVYKAVLSDSTRIACTSGGCATSGNAEHINWILKANTNYVQLDGFTPIGTTTAFGVFSSQSNNILPLNTVWVYATGSWSGASNNSHCTSWSGAGFACQNPSSNILLGGCGQSCTVTYNPIVCVEQ